MILCNDFMAYLLGLLLVLGLNEKDYLQIFK